MTFREVNLEKLQLIRLHKAIHKSDIETIKKLCLKGVPNLINLTNPIDGKTALIAAIEIDNEECVKILLELGADPSTPDPKKKSPLMYACELGLTFIVETLCKNNCNINALDCNSKSALSYCVATPSNRHTRCAELLFEYKIDKNILSAHRELFLEACMHSKDFEYLALLLLKNGVNPNVRKKDTRDEPLHYAALNGALNLCLALLKNEADPNGQNKMLQTPLMLAVYKGHLNVIKLLFSFGANFNLTDIHGNNAIHYAVENKHIHLIECLASRGADPFIKNKESLKPIRLAKSKKLPKRRKIFRKAKSRYEEWKLKFSNTSKQALLSNTSGNLEIILWFYKLYDFVQCMKERLLALLESIHGYSATDTISKDFLEEFLGEHMIESMPKDIINKLLLSKSLEQEQSSVSIDKFFNTDYYFASVVPMFSKGKVKKAKKKKKTKSVGFLTIPVREENSELNPIWTETVAIDSTKMIDEDSAQNNLANDLKYYMECKEELVNIFNAINSGNLPLVRKIFHENSRRAKPRNLIEIQDKYYKTPLMIASAKGNTEMVEFFLSEKAKVNEIDNFKWTALHHAVLNGNCEIVQLLINNGANVNAKSLSDTTPLMIAILSNNLKLAEILIAKGARVFDIEKKNKETVKSLTEKFTEEPIKNFIETLEKNKNKRKVLLKARKITPKKLTKVNRFKENKKLIDDKLKPLIVEYYRNNERKVEKLILLNEKNRYAMKPAINCYENNECLMQQKERNRNIYGWEHDFPDFKTPLQTNVQRLLAKEKADLSQIKNISAKNKSK